MEFVLRPILVFVLALLCVSCSLGGRYFQQTELTEYWSDVFAETLRVFDENPIEPSDSIVYRYFASSSSDLITITIIRIENNSEQILLTLKVGTHEHYEESSKAISQEEWEAFLRTVYAAEFWNTTASRQYEFANAGLPAILGVPDAPRLIYAVPNIAPRLLEGSHKQEAYHAIDEVYLVNDAISAVGDHLFRLAGISGEQR